MTTKSTQNAAGFTSADLSLNRHVPSSTSKKMLARLKAGFRTREISNTVFEDLLEIIKALGFHPLQYNNWPLQFMGTVEREKKLEELEHKWNRTFVEHKDKIETCLSRRADIITEQVSPWILSEGADMKVGQLTMLDFGTGDGQVAEKISKQGISVTGVDVRDYRHQGVEIPFKTFDGYRTPFNDGQFDVVLATNVLHHEAQNQKAEAEIRRVLKPGGRFVVIETVPVGNSKHELEMDFERTFINDYFYNRILHPGANVPVPGTYDTPSGWKKRFGQWATPEFEENLGIDIPVIRDFHWIGVFRKFL